MYDFQVIVGYASKMIQIGKTCINKALKSIGLSSSEADVLMFLYANGDGIRQDQIAEGVEVSKPAISRTIHSLEKKGYIIREQSPKDRREYYVHLSAKALQHKQFVQKQYADIVEAACRGISEEKVTEIVGLFRKVIENMEDYRIEHGA